LLLCNSFDSMLLFDDSFLLRNLFLQQKQNNFLKQDSLTLNLVLSSSIEL
jgi:hypothetical protein